MLKKLCVGMIVLSSLIANCADKIKIPICAPPPLIDGNLSDPCWKNAFEIDTMLTCYERKKSKETKVGICRDPAWIYFSFDCKNENIRHIQQKVFEHDNMVLRDDSVEVYFFSKTEDFFGYQFMINFANVTNERKHPGPETTWNTPWKSATRVSDTGWTAELAIPLFGISKKGLNNLSLNIIRNFHRVTLDRFGAKLHLEKEKHSAAHIGKTYDINAYFDLSDLGTEGIKYPFAPMLFSANTKGYELDKNKLKIPVTFEISPTTEVTGKVKACVCDKTEEGVKEHSKLLDIQGKTTATISIPANDFGKHALRVELRNPENNEILSSLKVGGTENLEILGRILADRNYYTSEKMVYIQIPFRLQAPLSDKFKATLLQNNKILSTISLSQGNNVFSIPLSTFKEGNNSVCVLVEKGGTEFLRKVIEIEKLPPKPGYETKIDTFDRLLLKDGNPFFPFGIFIASYSPALIMPGDADIVLSILKKAGFNTILTLFNILDDPNLFHSLKTWLEAAERNDIYLFTWPNLATQHIRKASKQDKITQELYKKYGDSNIRKFHRIAKEYPNYLMTYNVDEPNLRDAEDRIELAKWIYKAIRETDMYHPIAMLYARSIPSGDKWTRPCDFLMYDIYSHPHWSNNGGQPTRNMAYLTWILENRAKKSGKITMIAPSGGMLDPARDPVPLSELEQISEGYAAIIHGAKGLFYFNVTAIAGPENWRAIRTLSERIKAFSPALLNRPVPQDVSYSTGKPNYSAGNIPDVIIRIYAYPSGEYLLLATNMMRNPVQVEISISGLQKAEQLFTEKKTMTCQNGLIKDAFEPLGVRSYKLSFGKAPEKIKAIVNSKILSDKELPYFPAKKMIAKAKTRKNHIPNPLFTESKAKGVPAFIMPHSLLPCYGDVIPECSLDSENPWNGKPSLRMIKKAAFPGGTPKLRGIRGTAYPPEIKEDTWFTFSCYMKSSTDGAEINARLLNARKTFKLTKEWTHYQFSVLIKPDTKKKLFGGILYLLYPKQDATIWLSGLQLEKGKEATDFCN